MSFLPHDNAHYFRTTLSNGLTVVGESYPGTRSVALGFAVNAGVITETPEIGGISHFIEHLMFKGTKRRSARELNRVLTAVGGELNAFTDRELTFFYTKVLDEHLAKACDVLGDMLTNSLIAEDAIELERKVILEEICMYEDTPDEQIHEMAAGNIFSGALSQTVLGTTKSMCAINRAQIMSYISNYYCPANSIVAIAGNFDEKSFLYWTEKAFKCYSNNKETQPKAIEYPAIPVFLTKDTEQTHVMLAWKAFPYLDEDRYAIEVMNTCLGGNAASRLFMSIRENRGLAYSVYSYTRLMQDQGGLFIYAGTNTKNAQKVIGLCKHELEKLAIQGPGVREIKEAREHLRGVIALSMESSQKRMLRLVNEEVYLQQHMPVSETLERIKRIEKEDVKRVARRLLDSPSCLVAIGPSVSKLKLR